jgi:hypothetical protein
MYQFRHIRLQERLATQPRFVTTGIRPPALTATTEGKRRRMTARVLTITTTIVIASTAIVTLLTFNHLRCESPLSLGADVNRVRSFNRGSPCVGIVPKEKWDQLNFDPLFDRTVFDQLRAGNKDAKGSNAVTVAIFGPLSTTDPGMSAVILRQLDGVVRAQSESKLRGRPIHVELVNTGAPGTDESVSAAFDRAVSLIGRADTNMPTMVDLGILSRQTSATESIPVFSADIRRGDAAGKPLSETRAEFDQQLQNSLMNRFFQYTLGVSQSDYITPPLDNYYMQLCVSTQQPVLVYKGPESNGPIVQFLSQAKACRKGHVRVMAPDSSVADYLQHVPVRDFPSLTVYYPVAEATSTAHRCEGIPVRAFPTRAGTLADADVAAEFSCQATLNAAGMGNVVINEMGADQNKWITKPVPG